MLNVFFSLLFVLVHFSVLLFSFPSRTKGSCFVCLLWGLKGVGESMVVALRRWERDVVRVSKGV